MSCSIVRAYKIQLDANPNLSPKPSPRAFQSSRIKSNAGNKIEPENEVSGNLGVVNISIPKANGYNIGMNHSKEDVVDEGLAALKRQPSIKDRRKVH